MDGYEFEITLKDLSLLEQLSLIKIDYEDSVIYDINNDTGIAYRYYPASSTIERKIILQKNDITDTILPLVFRYAKEDTANVDDSNMLNDAKLYIRKQRVTYKSMLPALADWRIEKTIRFFTDSASSNKLTTHLLDENVESEYFYDIVDVEFEYTGEAHSIIRSVSDLLSTLFPVMFKYVNITYGRINSILRTDISQLGQKVDIITQDIINREPITRYSITEKIDGERCLLIVFGNDIYIQLSTSFKRVASVGASEQSSMFNRDKRRSLIIVDTEYLNDTYYMFDLLYANGKVSENFTDRTPLIDAFILEYGDYINMKRLSSFTLTTWDDALDFIDINETSTVFNNVPIDGIILRDGNKLYKLKNKSHLTVDFLIRYNHLDGFCYLFTIGDPKEVITEKPFTEPYNKLLFGYHLSEKINTSSAYILADFPYMKASYRLIMDDYALYDGKVTEMLLTEDGSWKPVRIRHDKEYPNGYKIALSLYGLMYNDRTMDARAIASSTEDKITVLKQLYPTFINTHVKAFVLSSDVSIVDVFSNYHSVLGMLYIASSQMNTINMSLYKLSMSKIFYNKDIKGLLFRDYRTIFNDMLSLSAGFYKQSLNYAIIDDVYTYAPSYIDLYAMCNFLKESISIDGVIMLYFDLTIPVLTKPTKAATIARIIGNHEGTRRDASVSFKVGPSTYHVSVPASSIYDVPFKDILNSIDRIKAELIDNIIRYDDYLTVIRKYFDVTNTILTEKYIILSLAVKDD